MSDTPETNAQEKEFLPVNMVRASFARQLERERDEAREELRQWREAAKGAENPHPDEVHCTCVPLLRGSLALARKQRDEARDVARWLYQHGMATLIEGAHRNEWIKEERK